MKKNLGEIDRMVRIGLALALAGTALFGTLAGTVSIILGIAASLLLVTAGSGICPLYGACSLSTRSEQVNQGDHK